MKKNLTLIFRFLLLSIAFCSVPGLASAQRKAYIPDPRFRLYLSNTLCMDGDSLLLDCPEVKNSIGLNVNGWYISDLTGMEHFQSIRYFYCDRNALTTLPPIPAHWQLEEMTCENNQLISLPALPSTLKELRCANNRLSSLPALPSSLRLLICGYNRLTLLPSLPSSLSYLWCQNNQLTALPGGITASEVNCSSNFLTSLPALPHTNTLDCSNNRLTALPVLSSYMSQLICDNNSITAVPDMTGKVVEYFSITGNQLTALPGEDAFPQVNTFRCGNNKLTFEDLEPVWYKIGRNYTPQAVISLASSNVLVNAGQTLSLSIPADGAYSTYQWFRNGVAVSAVSSSPVFTKANVAVTDGGSYTCRITHPYLSQLTLTTTPIVVTVAMTAITFSPADNAVRVAPDRNLSITFSESVSKGTGTINIRRSNDDMLLESFDVASFPGIVINGTTVTINPVNDLPAGKGVYVEIPGTAFRNAANLFYAGTTDKNTWNFTVAVPPTSSNSMATATEDVTYTFAASDFSFFAGEPGAVLSSVQITLLPARGLLTFNGAPVAVNQQIAVTAIGGLKFAPAANQNGTHYTSFMFKVGDGMTYSLADYAMTIHVMAVNDAPVAVADVYTVNEDEPLGVAAPGVLENDVDVDGDWLSTVIVSTPAHGLFSLSADGSFVYIPDYNFSGSDSFTYKTVDATGSLSVAATVTITVNEVNDQPVGTADTYAMRANQVLNVLVPGVLANDRDVEGDALTAVSVTMPAHGTISLNANGSFVYTPNAGFVGVDTLNYEVVDARGAVSGTTRVSITVDPAGNAPVVVADSYSVDEDNALTVAAPGVLANDRGANGTTLSAVLQVAPSNGTVTLNADGSFVYTPAANFHGTDQFYYKAYDSAGDSSALAKVTVRVNSINDVPAAGADAYAVNEDSALTIPAAGVLANDSDADGNPLSAVQVASPAHGTLSLNADGSFVYTPAANFFGTDQFTYRATDAVSASAVTTVTITVNNVNDAPVAVADVYSVDENQVLNVAAPGILANDSDADGDVLSAVLVSSASNGTLVLNADGSFMYTPIADFNGSDSFTYKLVDTTGGQSAVKTVNITVNSINTAPVLADIETTVLTNPGNLASVMVSSTLTLRDDSSITGATVAVSGIASNCTDCVDKLNFTAQNGITGAWNATSRTLTLSGTASVVAYQAALRSITYSNTGNTSAVQARTVTFSVTDGQFASNTVSRMINFSPVSLIISFTPSGTFNTFVTINGTNLTGATALKFNGKAATILTNNGTQVTARVPVGATTGKITLETPRGIAISATDFVVADCPVVTGLTATPVMVYGGFAAITLNWDAAPYASHYRVYYRAQGTSAWSIAVATPNFITLGSLTPGVRYEFAVKTYCGDDSGASTSWLSPSVTATVATDGLTCETPTGITAIPARVSGSSGVVVTWNTVNYANNYIVRYKLSSATTWSQVMTTNNTVAIALPAGSYNFTVQTRCSPNSVVVSAVSGIGSFVPGTGSICPMPTGLTATGTATAPDETTTILKWNAVAGAQSYTVRYKKDGETTWIEQVATTNSLTVQNLWVYDNYLFTVQTRCSATSVSAISPSLTFMPRFPSWTPGRNTGDDAAKDELKNVAPFEVKLYPNPSSDMVTVATQAANGRISLRIYNVLGVLVYEKEAQDELNEQISFGHLPKGVYMVRVTSNNQTATQRMVIE